MGQLKVPKPKAIIMDMSGTAVKTGFIEKILMPYVKDNVKEYLEKNWSDKQVQKDIESLRKAALKDESGPKIAAKEADAGEQQQSIADFVTAAIDGKKESNALSRFRFHMWFEALEKGKLETPVYSDVAIQIKKWKDLDTKIYVFSNGWDEAIKKFLKKTSQGDLSLMVDGVYDSSTEGSMKEAETYTKLCQKIGQPPDQVLFLTKASEEGKAAKEAGLPIVLVLTHRKNIEKLTEEEKSLPRIRSFNELDFDSQG